MPPSAVERPVVPPAQHPLHDVDLSGLVLAGPAASRADRLRIEALARRRPAVTRWLEQALGTSSAPGLRRVLSIVQQQSAVDWLATFDHPLLASVAHTAASTDALNERDAWVLASLVIMSPAVSDLFVIIPSSVLDGRGLYLPHMHARLRPSGGPLVIETTATRMMLTSSAGCRITLPRQLEAMPPCWGLTWGRSVAGWPVVNGVCPELSGAKWVAAAPTPTGSENLADGLALLQRAWPEAYTSCRRFFSVARELVATEDHTYSYSSPHTQGLFNATFADPLQVGDALCHEAAHTRLELLLHEDPLLENHQRPEFVSPWRPDLRPLLGLVHGVHAFINVCLYYEKVMLRHPELAPRCEPQLLHERRRLLAGWNELCKHAKPTAVGAALLAEMATAVDHLRVDLGS